MNSLEQYAQKIWTLLVEQGGAREENRLDFVLAVCATEYPCTEYRFMGDFGFGGKCYLNAHTREARIGYHPMDLPAGKEAEWEHRMKEMNAQIHEYHQEYIQGIAALSAGPSAP